ncbi:unnamed protein product, partial [Rotaria sp. Silwood1]
CGPTSYYAFAFSIYLFIFIEALPPIFMVLFGLLTRYNLKQARSRISPGSDYTQHRLRKSDRDLMKMVAGEVFVYLVSTILYPVNTLYGFITGPIAQQKSGMRLAIEALAGFIVSPLLSFLYCVAPYYGRVRLSILY